MNVLVLDDEKDLLAAVRGILEADGHVVDTVESAEQAVTMIESGKYDFMLIDYKMPEKDGAWFMRQAKIPRSTKVILMTAYLNKKVADEMFKLGVVGYIVKPFNAEALRRHLAFHSRPKDQPVL